MSRFLNKISTKSLIDKATTDDQTSTPGFLYNEINKISFESVEQCQVLQDLLMKRLSKESPDVKVKTLRVIKQLLLKGHRSFRIELQRRTDDLQPCLDCRGPPDPCRGDLPYQRVREESQEIMKLMFVNNDRNSEQDESRSISSEAFGSSTSSTSTSFGGRIKGTGNFVAPPPSGFLETLKDSSSRLVSKVRGQSEEERFTNTNFELSNLGRPLVQDDFAKDYQVADRAQKPGTPGGSWAQDSHPQPTQKEEANSDDLSDAADDTVDRTSAEYQLVEKLTSENAVRPAPSKIEITQFVRKCNSLQLDLIMTITQQKLQSGIPWKSQLRALCLIEGLLERKVEGVTALLEIDLIQTLYRSPQNSVNTRAEHILTLLGVEPLPMESAEILEEPISISEEENLPDSEQDLVELDEQNTSGLFSGMQLQDSKAQPLSSIVDNTSDEEIPERSNFDFID